MKQLRQISRRSFLSDLGKGTVAVAILGTASCSSSSSSQTTVGAGSSATDTSRVEAPTGGGLAWERVNLGNVSAYVLARGSELTIVDTGVQGSEAEIFTAVEALGGSWEAVKHVILTHSHGDHSGSLGAVLEMAPDAMGYAGTGDLEQISSPFNLTGLNGGDEVFGLQVLATPGHTPGHISVYDPDASVFLAGDALNVTDGQVMGPNEQFSQDIDLANESVKGIAETTFETLLVGHGDPILTGAGAAVKDLAGTL